MGLLPAGFRFSQGSLAASELCPRRFYLRYLRRLNWPAAADEAGLAKERGSARGRLFHQLIHQHALGLPMDAQVAASGDPVLAQWWANYLNQPPQGLPAGEILSELELWVPLGRWWLTARFDRVVADSDGGLWIIDWKTGRGEPATYLETWQTLVYCFVLCEGGALLIGGARVVPERISLCYWSAAFPDRVQWYRYDQVRHARAREKLQAAIGSLAGLASPEGFAKTPDMQHCLNCEYQSYCARGPGVGAGWETDEEDEEEWGSAPGLEF